MCSVMCKMCIFRIKILYLSIHIIVVSSTAWKVSVFGVILVRFFPHFPAFGLNTNRYVFNPNAGKCGKNAEQNNSEYGQFLRSVQCQFWAYWPQISHTNAVFLEFTCRVISILIKITTQKLWIWSHLLKK